MERAAGGISPVIFHFLSCISPAGPVILQAYRGEGSRYEPDDKRRNRTVTEYRVEIYAVRKAETEMNRMASDGWRVIAVCPNQAAGFGVVVTYERQR